MPKFYFKNSVLICFIIKITDDFKFWNVNKISPPFALRLKDTVKCPGVRKGKQRGHPSKGYWEDSESSNGQHQWEETYTKPTQKASGVWHSELWIQSSTQWEREQRGRRKYMNRDKNYGNHHHQLEFAMRPKWEDLLDYWTRSTPDPQSSLRIPLSMLGRA